MTDAQNSFIEELYLEMYDMLYHYANLQLNDPELAEEVVQEVFQIACAKPEALMYSLNPKGWIILTLKNVLRNAQRKQFRRQNLFITLGLQNQTLTAEQEPSDLHFLYGELSKTKDFELIQEFADGTPIQELAAGLGISENACKKRIQRAKEKLRKKFQNFEK